MEIVKGFDISDFFDVVSSADIAEAPKKRLLRAIFFYSGLGVISTIIGIYFSYHVLSNYQVFNQEYPYVLFFFKSLNRLLITYFISSVLFIMLARFFPQLQAVNIIGIFISSFVAGVLIFFPIRALVIIRNLANLSHNIYPFVFFFTAFMILLPFVVALFSRTSFNIAINSLITVMAGVSILFLMDWNFVPGFKNWMLTSAIFLFIFQFLLFVIFNMVLKSDVYDSCPAAAALLLLNSLTGIVLSILVLIIALIIMIVLIPAGLILGGDS